MQQYTNIDTRVFRGCGFMTIAKYNNSGEQIYIADKDSKIITAIETFNYSIVGTYIGHNGIIWNLDLSFDDSILISSSGDLTICFFDTSNGNILYQINEKDKNSKLIFISATSCMLNGAPASPSTQHAPLQAARSQTNLRSNTSEEIILSSISINIW